MHTSSMIKRIRILGIMTSVGMKLRIPCKR
nr:MAG TPA: hypothetical protein [Caudoviricetes sp.]